MNRMPHVFNFCFTDVGEHINDVLKIMSGCGVFCLFCRLITKIAVDFIGLSKVNVSASKNRPLIELWIFIQTMTLNVFRLMSISFLLPYSL